MEAKTVSRDPSLGLIFVLLLSHVLLPCVCETIPLSNNSYSELKVDGDVTLSNASGNREYNVTAVSKDESVLESGISSDLPQDNRSSSTQPINVNQSSSVYSRVEDDTNVFSDVGQEGGEKTPSGPSLSHGGGIAGAISRLVGLVPMLASRLTSKLGLSRRRRALPDEQRAAYSDTSLPQQHLEIIQNLNRYYSGLSGSTKAKHRPTLEQLKAHREYLLHLLEQMRHSNKGKVDIPDDALAKTDNSSSPVNYGKELLQDIPTDIQQDPLTSPPQNISSVSQNGNENKGNVTIEQFHSPTHSVDVRNTSLAGNQRDEKGEESDSQFSNRLGPVMADHSDIQTEDVDKVALLLHQFQTQGDVNLFPKNFLEKLSVMAKNPGRRYNLFQTTQPTVSSKPANKVKLPGLSQMEQQIRPNTLSTENDHPLSFLHTAHKNGVQPSGSDSASRDKVTPINLHAEPSRFADLSTLKNALQSVSQMMAEPPPQPVMTPVVSTLNTVSALSIQGPNNMEQVGRPIANLPGFQNGLPLSIINPPIQTGPGSLDSLADEMSPTFDVPGQFPEYGPPSNTILGNTEMTEDPNVVIVDGVNFQDIGPLGVPLSSVAFNASDVIPATIQDNRISTELTTALTNFINNIAMAISQLLTDLQAALEANPLAVLLLLLPLLLLPFLLEKFQGGKGGYGGGGGGGYGHRRVIYENPHSKTLVAERLAQKILNDIDSYERLFMNTNDPYLRNRAL